jgi:hypothetical protein
MVCRRFPFGLNNRTLAFYVRLSDYFTVETLTIKLNDDIARRAKESAQREHKSISEWIEERIKFGVDRTGALAALESRAVANGYPPGWLELYASLADDTAFVAPARSSTRPMENLNDE